MSWNQNVDGAAAAADTDDNDKHDDDSNDDDTNVWRHLKSFVQSLYYSEES